MPKPTFDSQLAASILVEAVFHGDTATAEKFGITTRTIRNYRKRLLENPDFSADLAERVKHAKNTLLSRTWAENLDLALNRTIVKMLEAVEGQPEYIPEALEAITGAFSALSEFALAREVLGVADRKQNAAAEAPGRGATGTGATLN